MKPVIGITVCIDAGRLIRPNVDYLYLGRRYAQAVALAGAVPILLSPEASAQDCLALCAGLIVSGGGDLPRRFDDEQQEKSLGDAEHPARITWERELLALFSNAHKPVLGVCYGMQLINLHCGGTLYRSVAAEVKDALNHGGQGAYQEHDLQRSEESVLLSTLPKRFRANSSHGQAIRDLAPGFVITARSDDGVVEAIEHAERLLFGVEWHPESDATGVSVYAQFARVVMQQRGVE